MKCKQSLLPFYKHLFHSGDRAQGGVGTSTEDTDGGTNRHPGDGLDLGHMERGLAGLCLKSTK